MNNNTNVSLGTLNDVPARALLLVRGIATHAEIRAIMASGGYTEADQQEGWSLLLTASGFTPAPVPAGASADDVRARSAIAELDAWDEPGFRRIHAALGHLHPAQDEFVFAGLGPSQGPGAVVGISLLLDRLDALESSPDRTSTRKEDHAALATLAKRGIDAGVRKHLRALIQDAQRAALPATVPASPPPDEQAREQALQQLYVWYKDWSETAHALIHRRDYLIMLGLAQRHSQQQPEPAPVPAPAPVANPVPVVAPSAAG